MSEWIAKVLELTEDTSWLEKRVKNPETGNEVFVKSLPIELRDKYRPKDHPSGSYEQQKNRVKLIAKDNNAGNWTLRSTPKGAELLNKDTEERLQASKIAAMTDDEIASLMKGKPKASGEVKKEPPKMVKKEPVVSGGSVDPANLGEVPKSKYKSSRDFAEMVNNVSAKEVKPIGHGINPSFFITSDKGEKLVMKVENKGDGYNQSKRFSKMLDEIGWGYLTPGLHMGRLNGEVEVSKKKQIGKEGDKQWVVDKDRPPSKVKNPDGIFAELVDGMVMGRGDVADKEVVSRAKKIKSDDVIRAALLDGLTSSRDRHSDNVMIGKNGEINLIDNTFLFSPQFAPKSYFTGLRHVPPGREEDLGKLDYSKHVKGGRIGTSYPAEFKKFMSGIIKMTDGEIKEKYEFDDDKKAGQFKSHVQKMLTDGFESACKIDEYKKKMNKGEE